MAKRTKRRGVISVVRKQSNATPPPANPPPQSPPARLDEQDPPALFTLEFQKTDGADAVLPFRWHLTPHGVEALEQLEIENPHLLIFVTQEVVGLDRFREVARMLIPIAQGNQLHYLRFDRPGVCRLRAVIVHGSSRERLKERFMSHGADGLVYTRDSRGAVYSLCELFSESTGMPSAAALNKFLGCVATVPLTVDSGHFAQPIPDTTWSRFVNSAYSRPPADQCDYRRRQLLSPLWALAVVGLLIFRIVALVVTATVKIFLVLLALLLGCRIDEIELDFAEHGNFQDILGAGISSYYSFTDTRGETRPTYQAMLRIPLLYLVNIPACVRLISGGDSGQSASYWGSVIVLGITGFVFFIAVLVHILEWFFTSRASRKEAVNQQGDEQVDARAQRLLEQRRAALLQLVDTGDDTKAVKVGVDLSYEQLPATERTLRVRYQRLKAKVCAPFARP